MIRLVLPTAPSPMKTHFSLLPLLLLLLRIDGESWGVTFLSSGESGAAPAKFFLRVRESGDWLCEEVL